MSISFSSSPRPGRRCKALGESGVSAIEFALILPFLVMLLLGAIEITRLIVIHHKLDKISHSMADLVARGETVDKATLDSLTDAAVQIFRPFTFDAATIVFTSVINGSDPENCKDVPNCVAWQYSKASTGTPSASSVAAPGGPGSSANLNDYFLAPGEDVIVSEVFYSYQPLFEISSLYLPAGIGTESTLYKFSMYRPRLNALNKCTDC